VFRQALLTNELQESSPAYTEFESYHRPLIVIHGYRFLGRGCRV